MPITPEQKAHIARTNGARSRGPITPEGKAASAANATKHGLTARQPCLATEDAALYGQVRQLHLDHYRPATAYETDLVDQLAAIAWRLRRAESIETALLDQEIDIRKPEIEKAFQTIDREGLWAIGYKSLGEHSTALQNLDRHQTRLARHYARVAAALEKTKFQNEPTAETPC